MLPRNEFLMSSQSIGDTGTLTVGTLPPISSYERAGDPFYWWDGMVMRLNPSGTATWLSAVGTGFEYQGLVKIAVLPDGSFYVVVSSGKGE